MAFSILSLYQKVLPKTNCGDCGLANCLAFAGLVVSDQMRMEKCPHLTPDVVDQVQRALDEQHSKGIGTKKDLAREALLGQRSKTFGCAGTIDHQSPGGRTA